MEGKEGVVMELWRVMLLALIRSFRQSLDVASVVPAFAD